MTKCYSNKTELVAQTSPQNTTNTRLKFQ